MEKMIKNGPILASILFFMMIQVNLFVMPVWAQTDEETVATYKFEHAQMHESIEELNKRVEQQSKIFLGTTYQLGPLGEGKAGKFDQDPLYDLHVMDCLTFVEHVMAFSMDSNFENALNKTLQQIRYKDGVISFVTRNHFTSIEWIPANTTAGYISDITQEVAGKGKWKIAAKWIDRKAWYESRTLDDIERNDLKDMPEEQKQKLVAEFQSLGKDFEKVQTQLPYIPVKYIPKVQQNIPSGTMVCIVRENVPDKAVIISHVGLIIQSKGKTMLRHAKWKKTVQDEELSKYLKSYKKSKWKIAGINLLRIQKP
ncbi:N-acetylmuramoyl-L-alanine amidase-like domain-containing protein [Elusimicrobiota bacterium]